MYAPYQLAHLLLLQRLTYLFLRPVLRHSATRSAYQFASRLVSHSEDCYQAVAGISSVLGRSVVLSLASTIWTLHWLLHYGVADAREVRAV